MNRTLKQLRADLGAGLFLVLPLTVALYILTRLWQTLHAPVRMLAERLGIDGVLKVNGLLILTGVVLIGLLASIGRLIRMRGKGKVRDWAEKMLTNHVPGYTYIRVILEARLGLAEPPEIHPALLETGDGWQPVFLVEQLSDNKSVLYLPDVPLGGTGSVLIAENAKVTVLGGSVLHLDTALRKYGKGIGPLLNDTAPGSIGTASNG